MGDMPSYLFGTQNGEPVVLVQVANGQYLSQRVCQPTAASPPLDVHERAVIVLANSADKLDARVKELEAKLELVREKAELYHRCANECRQASHNVAMMHARAELYDIIARELAALLAGEQ